MVNPLLLGLLGDGVRKVLDSLFPNAEDRAKAEIQLRQLEAAGTFEQRAALQLAQMQAEVNKAEASTDAYRGGWRPAVGWTCAAALAWQFVVAPMATWGCALAGVTMPPVPKLDGMLWELLIGMLGLGALRTVEKVKGAA